MDEEYPVELLLSVPKKLVYYLFTLMSLVDFSDNDEEKKVIVTNKIIDYLLNASEGNEEIVFNETADIINGINMLRNSMAQLSKQSIDNNDVILRFSDGSTFD